MTVLGRCLPAALAALAVVLAGGFVLAPRLLAGPVPRGATADEKGIGEAFRAAFVTYWHTESRQFPAELQSVVDYWCGYHVAKAVFAGLLLLVLAALAVLVWKSFLRTERAGIGLLARGVAGTLVTLGALGSLLLVMANIQGMITPFGSLFPLLTDGFGDPDLGQAVEQVRAQAAAYPHGAPQPATQAMIDEFALYHLVMAVLAGLVATACIVASAVLWKRSTKTPPAQRRTRRLLLSFGVAAMLLSAAMIAVTVANIATTADPAPALAALFAGSW
ncbi:hypothetical protein D7D52_14545 [Nocardia yunnanensis]|uniref:Tat (Twin-arginine translocation) pathway signal sequence n=1 Tax=Nocardia yunnanensis TaxID=2382165 RepID=A0A386ZAL4_9NOCA|nr:hypothetical protein D7D52_14545 [Nocardia yunnanensis]